MLALALSVDAFVVSFSYGLIIKKGKGKFCSISCATTYKNLTNNPSWREEVRLKISQNHADVSGKNNPMFGRTGAKAPSYIDGRNKYKGGTYHRILKANNVEEKCVYCGCTEKIEVHHVDGNRRNNDISNLVYVCRRCHLTKAHTYKRDDRGMFTGSLLNSLERR